MLNKEQINYFYSIYASIDGQQEFIEHSYPFLFYSFLTVLEENNLGAVFLDEKILLALLIGENEYTVLGLSASESLKIQQDDNYLKTIIKFCIDKYRGNVLINPVTKITVKPNSPLITTARLYINSMLKSIEPFCLRVPNQSLLADALKKALITAKGLTTMITHGFGTEAFVSWRTLHELECIIRIINTYKLPVVRAYLQHIEYNSAFRGGVTNKEECDAIFVNMKAAMAAHELKSKDMKKFIEYGFLYEVPNIYRDFPDWKLNFRDGVERIAGLQDYNEWYEMASEIAHGSTILIYSNQDYFVDISMIGLLETILRLDTIFDELYQIEENKEQFKEYNYVKTHYCDLLKALIKKERNRFFATEEEIEEE